MDKQIIVVTEAELRGLKYGQDIVTEMSQNIDGIDRFLIGAQGFIDGLLESITAGKPVPPEQLQRLRDEYIGRAKDLNDERREKARLLWRHMQDEENKARMKDEIARGVNR